MPKPVTIWQTWESAITILKSTISPITRLSFWAIFCPNLIGIIALSFLSQPVVETIRSKTEELSTINQALPYHNLVELSSSFLITYLIITIILVLMFLATYLGMIHIAAAFQLNKPIPHASQAFKIGLKLLFPKGILITISCVVALGLDQYLFGGFLVISVFCLMGYVIAVIERRGAIGCIKQALLFRYTSPATGGGFSVGLILILIGAIAGLLIQSIGIMNEWWLKGDEWFSMSRFLWSYTLPGLPFSFMYFIAQIGSLIASSGLAALFAAMSVSLFFQSSRATTKILSKLD